MTKEEAVVELVLETAEQIGSDVLNSGGWLQFLLDNGWTPEEIKNRLGEMVDDPDTLSLD